MCVCVWVCMYKYIHSTSNSEATLPRIMIEIIKLNNTTKIRTNNPVIDWLFDWSNWYDCLCVLLLQTHGWMRKGQGERVVWRFKGVRVYIVCMMYCYVFVFVYIFIYDKFIIRYNQIVDGGYWLGYVCARVTVVVVLVSMVVMVEGVSCQSYQRVGAHSRPHWLDTPLSITEVTSYHLVYSIINSSL